MKVISGHSPKHISIMVFFEMSKSYVIIAITFPDSKLKYKLKCHFNKTKFGPNSCWLHNHINSTCGSCFLRFLAIPKKSCILYYTVDRVAISF